MPTDPIVTPVDPHYDTKPNDQFRITFHVRSHYDVNTVNKIIGALKTGANLVDSGPWRDMTGLWLIDDVEAQSNDGMPYVPLNNGQYIDWNLIVTATRVNTGTELIIVIGLILGVLVALGGVILVLGWTAEKIEKGFGGSNGVFSAGAILAVFIIALLIMTKGKVKA